MTNAERYLSFAEVVDLIQPCMPGKNAAALLLADGFGNPQIPWLERNGRRIYALSDVAAFATRVLGVELDEDVPRDARFGQRSGQDRRTGRERRVMRTAKLDPLADRRRTSRERRQMRERRGRNGADH